jgi:hypothetical protein
MRIRNLFDQGSGINIPDPQRCLEVPCNRLSICFLNIPPIVQGTLWGLLERWPDLVLRHMNRLDLAQAGLQIKNPPKKTHPKNPHKKTQ